MKEYETIEHKKSFTDITEFTNWMNKTNWIKPGDIKIDISYTTKRPIIENYEMKKVSIEDLKRMGKVGFITWTGPFLLPGKSQTVFFNDTKSYSEYKRRIEMSVTDKHAKQDYKILESFIDCSFEKRQKPKFEFSEDYLDIKDGLSGPFNITEAEGQIVFQEFVKMPNEIEKDEILYFLTNSEVQTYPGELQKYLATKWLPFIKEVLEG